MSDSENVLSYPNRPDLQNVSVEDIQQPEEKGPTFEYPNRQGEYHKPMPDVQRTDGTVLAYNTTAVDLIARKAYLAAGDFSNLKVERLTAYDRNLSDADLSGARLLNSRLNRWDLKNADLSGAHIENCDCSNWDLSGARLDGATFTGCTVSGMKAPGLKRARLIRCVGIPEEIGSDE